MPFRFNSIFYRAFDFFEESILLTDAIRYIGFWFSPGLNITAVFYDDDGDIEKAFAWELGFDMIFRSRFTVNLGFGGNAGNYRDSSHFLF